jgi:nucleotide-binding universal stress UspA family protein
MNRFKNILFFADGSEVVSPALRRAAQLAHSNHARLTLVDVVEPISTPDELNSRYDIDLQEMIRLRRNQLLEELSASIADEETIIYTRILTGTPFIEVIKYVQQGGFDLLVKMASPPAGISERLFGSVDLHLLRKCPCPVLIDRPSASAHYQRVLAAVDIEPDTNTANRQGCGQQVMQLASSLATREQAALDIVHAWQLPGESTFRNGRFRLPTVELESMLRHHEAHIRQKLSHLLKPHGIDADSPNVHLVKGLAAEAINHAAVQNASDVVVMGTVGRIGIPGFFIGNTAEEVIQTTRCSVLAVKPVGFKSPVE